MALPLGESIPLSITDSLKESGITFYKIKMFSESDDTRIVGEKDGNIYFYDDVVKKTICIIPNDQRLNYKVQVYGLEFSILDYDSNLVTPYCEYSNLIKIKVSMINSDDDMEGIEYYKRGVGVVALEVDGELHAYLSAKVKK